MKNNIIANCISQFSLIIIGLIMMPVYINTMGAESFGLIGFYMMLQAWIPLLDMGMTPTLTRETAQYRGKNVSLTELKTLLRTLESTFFCIALLIICLFYIFAHSLASNWLNVQHTPVETVKTSLLLMSCAVTVRWTSNLYRGVIIGFEKIVWISNYNIIIGFVRFICIAPIILWFNNGPVTFFSYQLLISLFEIIILRGKSNTLCLASASEKTNKEKIPLFHWATLRRIYKFSGTIAVTSSIWAMVTQSDKLLLSKILMLSNYAYFTMAVMAASGIATLGNTIAPAIMPRLSKLNAEKKHNEIILLYRIATKAIAAISIPATVALAVFSEQILFAWTGDKVLSEKTATTLSLYTLGNGFLVFNAFPYYLQYAYGNLRLHFIGSILFLILFLPLLMFSSIHYGIVGAGWSWFIANLVSFSIWIPYLHRRLCPGLHPQWLIRDIGISMVYCTPLVVFLNYFIHWPDSRIQMFFMLLTVCTVLLFSTLIPFLVSNHFIRTADIRRQYEKYFIR